MKIIIILILSLFHIHAIAQNSREEPSKSDKPSWTGDLPQRQNTPDLDIQDEMDTSIDLELDRNSMFDSEDDTGIEIIEEQPDELESDDAQGVADAQRIAEEEAAEAKAEEEARIVAEEKAAEEAKAAAEAEAAQEKAAAEAIAAAEAESLAEENNSDAQENSDDTQNSDEVIQEQVPTDAVSQAEDAAVNDEPISAEMSETQQLNAPDYVWRKVKNVLPNYPPKAARDKKEGWVDVEITLASDGSIIDAQSIKSYRNQKLFVNAAIEAVKQWTFDPPINYGIQDNQVTVVRIIFKL